MKKEWLTREDLELEFGIKIKTQNTLRSKRKLQYTKIGRDCHYKREWVEAYLEKNTVKACF